MAQSLLYKLKQDFIPDDLVDTINAFFDFQKTKNSFKCKIISKGQY